MTRRVFKGIAIGLLSLLLVLICAALFLLWPEGENPSYRAPSDMDLSDILAESLVPSSASVDLMSLSARISVSVDDARLNSAVDAALSGNTSFKEKWHISAHQVWIRDGFVRFKANVSLGGVLPAQITLDAKPTFTDKLHLDIVSAKLGRLPIDPDALLDMAGVSAKDGITVDVPGMAQGMSVEGLTVERGRITGEVVVRVRSLEDFTRLAQGLGSRAGQALFDAVQDALPASAQ